MRTRCLLVFALSSLCFAPRVASAQEGPAVRAEAQVLFDQASALMDGHDYANACPKLEQALRLLPGKIGGLLTLGECYEGEGRLASAWTIYRQAANRATALGDARAREAQQEADALEARLPRLRIQLDAGTKGLAGLEVKRDGVPVVATLWGTPVPVEPGQHVVEVRVPEHPALRFVVMVKAGESRDIVVTRDRVTPDAPVAPDAPVVPVAPVVPIAPVAPVAPPPRLPPALALVPVPSAVPRDTAEPPRGGGSQRRAGLIVGGVGVAGLGVAGVLGIVTLVKAGALPQCGNSDVTCIDDQRNPGIRGAEAVQTAGFVMLGVGAAATVTGIVLFATAQRAPSPVAVSVSVGPSGGTLRGAW